MDISSVVQTIAVYAIPLIFAITIHETAHGYVAKLCGDQTAYMLGRLTLNPIKHIDPVGTILVPGALLIGSALSGMSALCSVGQNPYRSISAICAILKPT